jgi:hypothetical protein
MTSYIFQQISEKGRAENLNETAQRKDSKKWFQSALQTLNKNSLNNPNNITTLIDADSIGKMYMFAYNPKHKDTLPYYDRFPLVVPYNLTNNGFIGINLHYLPPVLRAKLMNTVYQMNNSQQAHNVLSIASNHRYFKACVKQYLRGYVQSAYLNIEPANWDLALMLPTERFAKASKEQVWKDSRGVF